jgi:hypothetical protein
MIPVKKMEDLELKALIDNSDPITSKYLNELLNLRREIYGTSIEEAACDQTYDQEDFDIQGRSGGNIDDAYEIGRTDGAISFARFLLKMIQK